MMTLPLDQLKAKIQEKAGLSAEEVEEKIKSKLSELSGLISEEGAAHIIANELNVKAIAPDAPVTVDKIAAGMRNIELVGKARAVYEVREFSNERRSGKVGNFLIMDQTGTSRIVLWNDQADMIKELKVGDVVRMKGLYSRTNNGRVELHLGTDGTLEINPEGVEIDVDVENVASARPDAQTKPIAELSGADQNVQVIATVVQVFDPKFFAACPECNSRVREENNYTCKTHGQVTPTYNYVMNLYLDDSTDNVRCVLWKEQVNELLAKSEEEMQEYREQPGAFENIKTELLGMIIKARGRVNNNEAFGRLELVAYDIEKDVDPQGAPSTKQETKEQKNEEEKKQKEEKETVSTESPMSSQTPVKQTTTTTKNSETKTETQAQTPTETNTNKAVEKKTTPTTINDAETEDDVFSLDDLEDLEELDD